LAARRGAPRPLSHRPRFVQGELTHTQVSGSGSVVVTVPGCGERETRAGISQTHLDSDWDTVWDEDTSGRFDSALTQHHHTGGQLK
ncbi:uncharacterized protein V6R79_014566, partial [Siganus canaliculatus]